MKWPGKRNSRLVASSLLILGASACATSQKGTSKMDGTSSVPFTYVNKTFIAVPVVINDAVTKNFILDTGIGLSLLSKKLCENLGCVRQGEHTGKRMSGQLLTIPVHSVAALSLPGLRRTKVPVGVWNMDQLMPGSDIGGFLSLSFFEDHPFTVDYSRQRLVIESADSMKQIRSQGVTVPVKLDRQDVALGIFLPLQLPNGEEISAEVDTGSQALILDQRFMAPLGISPSGSDVQRRDGRDETGLTYTRYFTKVSGIVHLPQQPKMGSTSPEVMFQKIIYDGLVGHYFLRQFVVTYDLPRSEMIFRNP